MNDNIVSSLSILYINKELTESNKELTTLKKYNKNLLLADNVSDAKKLYVEHKPNVVVTDVKLKNSNAFSLVKEIKSKNQHQPVIVKTKSSKKKHMLKALNLKVDSYLLSNDCDNSFIEKIALLGNEYLSKQQNIKKRQMLQNIIDNQSGLVILTSFDDISYCSKSFLDFFHLTEPDELFLRFDTVLDLFIKHDDYLHGNTKEEFLETFKNSKAIKKVVLMVGKTLTPKAFHIDINPVKIQNTTSYIITLTNISIMQEKNIEISYKAYIDGLTNVYNRNKFEEVFEYESTRNKRYKEDLSIAVLDIDHFKKFNDTFGHLIGDEVLKIMANTIKECVRKTDLFARWGGEEFVLLMPKTNLEQAKILCEKLRRLVESSEHEIAGKITCSFGITQYQKDDDLRSIFSRCDEALYTAKANGRNRVELN